MGFGRVNLESRLEHKTEREKKLFLQRSKSIFVYFMLEQVKNRTSFIDYS